MSIIPACLPRVYTIQSPWFSLAAKQNSTHTEMIISMNPQWCMSNIFPNITHFFEIHLPEITLTNCYNDQGLPFSEELQNTEMGHLFEHMIITLLYLKRMARGAQRAQYDGITTWNFTKYGAGVFYVKLSATTADVDIFQDTLKESCALFDRLFTAQFTQTAQVALPAVMQ